MAIDLDDEIVQDFLVEAGELLEKLGEQLVELEQAPDDYDLLNAIFRGFHTVKGGAGFLNIGALVDICHKAEDVFNILRQGERRVDAALMDVVLEVVDVVNSMFRFIRAGKEPEAAEPHLLSRLAAFAHPQGASEESAPPAPVAAPVIAPTEAAPAPAPPPVTPSPPTASVAPAPRAPEPTGEPRAPGSVVEEALFAMLDDEEEPAVPQAEVAAARALTSSPSATPDNITDEEFESLLDQLHGAGQPIGPASPAVADLGAPEAAPAAPAKAADEISDDEFEALLDELHGSGAPGAQPAPPARIGGEQNAEAKVKTGDEITEDEFEALLDNLHGQGQHLGVPITAAPELSTPIARAAAESVEVGSARGGASRAAAPTPPPPAETTVRVDTQRLDEIMNMVGELVLVRNRFQTLRSAMNDEEIAKAVANLDVVTSDLQLAVMKTRMQPIKKVFGRFPRVVRDLARSLNKEINLELRGEETDLDKNLVEALADPLVHLIRNAVDHGIEMPDQRAAAGKPREGLVKLTASQEGNHIELTIEDDGKGMDPEALRAKVVEKGLMDAETAARLDNRECFDLIFLPGFSTKTEISDVSGRGVGMDVVKTRIAQMNGSVAIDSIKGRGSRIIIKLPLTLAIMPTLMVKLNDQPFALPLASVVEILDLDLNRTNVVDGQMVVLVRQRALPLFYLKEWLIPGYYHDRKAAGHSGHVVVVNFGGRHIGFVVDHLVGQEEVVIKPLGAKLHGVAGMAGATITGDGKIALILDVPGLMKRYAPVR